MDVEQHVGLGNLWSIITRKHLGKLVGLFLIVSTLVVYLQVQKFDFVNIDDYTYVSENINIQNGLTSQGMIWAFTEFHASNWHPLTWLSHMLDIQLFGMAPGWHHLVNLLFHIANTLLLSVVLREMTGSLWRSAFVAALFALHPLHVESVAWISERKDVLSTFFWFLTISFYSRYVKHPSATRYLLVLATLALGLMSKPMVVTLPFVLLLLDFWPLARPGSRFLNLGFNGASPKETWPLIREKIPFFVLIALSSGLTLYAQSHGGAVASLEILDTGTRVANAIVSYFMYIVKMFLPIKLAAYYPHPNTLSISGVIYSGLMLVGISFLAFRLRTKYPYLLMGWLWYLGTMVPVIGLVQVGGQAMADRYTYIPLVGLFIMISWGGSDLLGKWPKGKVWTIVAVVILFSAIMAMTWNQVGYWKNSMTLFKHALEVTTNNSKAHTNLGHALDREGQVQEAIKHYQIALQIDPNYWIAHNNLGLVLDRQGQAREAIKHYRKAVQINPAVEEVHNNLGNTLVGLGQIQDAVKHYQIALQINPNFASSYNNLGLALEKQGLRANAIKIYKQALRLNPGFASAHHNLGVAYFRAGHLELAVTHLKKAIQIDPDYVLATKNLEKAMVILEQKNQNSGQTDP